MKKPILIILAAVILSLAASAAVYFSLNRKEASKANSAGEDSPYPYSWETDTDGSVKITLPDPGQTDVVWSASDAQHSCFTVTGPEQQKSSYVFVLKPTAQGIDELQLVCGKTGEPQFVYNLTVNVTQELQASISETSWTQIPAGGSLDLKSDVSCSWKNGTDGTLAVQLSSRSKTGYTWSLGEYDTALVQTETAYGTAGAFSVTVTSSQKEGSGTLEIDGVPVQGSLPGVKVTLAITVSTANGISVDSSDGAETQAAEFEEGGEEEKTAAEKVLGLKVALPEKALKQSWTVRSEEHKMIQAQYVLDNTDWILAVSSNMSQKALVNVFVNQAAEPTTSDQDGVTVSVYQETDFIHAVWSTGGVVYILSTEKTDTMTEAQILEAAKQILTLNGKKNS